MTAKTSPTRMTPVLSSRSWCGVSRRGFAAGAGTRSAVTAGGVAIAGGTAAGGAGDRSYHEVAGEPTVAEGRAPRCGAQDHPIVVEALIGHVVVHGLGHPEEDLEQLRVGVVVELDRGPEAAGQPGILGDEDRHR